MVAYAWMALAVLVGILLPVQFALNSTLTSFTHSPVVTAAFSYGGGAVCLLFGLLAVLKGRLPLEKLRGAPLWSLLGGVIGSAYIVGSVVLTRTLGTALAVSLVIAAQVVTSVVFDHFGVLGLTRRRLSPLRWAVLALVLSALALQVR